MGRYYDPATDQFLSVDRLVDRTLQPYGYAGDDPVNNSDPTELICTKPGPNHTCLASTDSAFGPGGNPDACEHMSSDGNCLDSGNNPPSWPMMVIEGVGGGYRLYSRLSCLPRWRSGNRSG